MDRRDYRQDRSAVLYVYCFVLDRNYGVVALTEVDARPAAAESYVVDRDSFDLG